MELIENLLSVPLGWLMYFCYQLVPKYAMAIIIFTIATKIILLPISIWLQKNSVKIVAITPELNRIKAKYYGDSDTIAEETSKLYKREKYNPFSSIIPLLVQLILLMGLVQIIYNPLTFIFRGNEKVNNAIVYEVTKKEQLDFDSSSLQMQVVDYIKKYKDMSVFDSVKEKYPKADVKGLLKEIKKSDMELCGLQLGVVPSKDKGWALLIPILAGLAALFLCVAQNAINPLQAEQGALNKYGMMIFSVALSLFLAYYVPIGVGFYWIWSNLFTILQQVLLNLVINPKKHIDYEALEESKKELDELSKMAPKKKLFSRNPNADKEKRDYKKFFSVVNKHLVIYAEGNGYYKYFKDIVEYILDHTNLTIHYITSDANDNIFNMAKECEQIRAYYISERKLISLMMKLECDIFLTSTPDLDNYHIKKSILDKNIEYIFVNHAMNSDNLTLRTHALDNFDTIFCTGKHMVLEQRAIEKLYNLPEKKLVETGYCLLDNMVKNYEKMDKVKNEVKTVLIAPSWQKDNIMDLCLEPLVENILKKGYKVIVRPHPQYVRLYQEKVRSIEEKMQEKYGKMFMFESDFSSNNSVYQADLLITDWSSISYEYSFSTYKPTLFINTPMKIMNAEYDKIDVVPFDIKVRDEIGASLDVADINNAGNVVEELISKTEEYHDVIDKFKKENFFGLGEAATRSGAYIIESIKEKIAIRKKGE